MPTKLINKVAVEVSIDELWELIAYHSKMFDSIPQKSYSKMTMAGHTLEVTAKKHLERWKELENLLDNTWPK